MKCRHIRETSSGIFYPICAAFSTCRKKFEMHGNEPKIEFSESKDAVNVLAEVPGMNEEDLDVEISSDGYLSISGEKKSRVEHEKGDNYFSEVSYGMFQRTVPLPWDLDYAKAEGDYEDGVLKIRIPKTAVEQSKKKKLPIKKQEKTITETDKTQSTVRSARRLNTAVNAAAALFRPPAKAAFFHEVL